MATRQMILYCAAIVMHGLGQGRTATVQSVDLFVPVAPVTFTQAGRTQLAYELHITNFLAVDVSLTAVRVLSGASGSALAEYQDQDLRQRIVRPGLRHDDPTPQLVGAGMRAVLMLWIALPAGEPAPPSVRHAVQMEVMRSTGPVSTLTSGGVATVTTSEPLALDPPLRGGPWVAIYDPLLKGGHRTAIYTVGGRARIPARFAIDWIALPPGGALIPKATTRPADWNGFGSEVLAVGDGLISAAADDVADFTQPPIPLELASGNYVAIDLGSGRFAFYEHLQRGSILVKVGDRVTRGQVIARLGASGSSSIGPHLHFHVSDANSALEAEGLPFVFNRFDHLGEFSSIGALVNGEKWSAAPVGSRPSRSRERPEPNAVLRFP